MAVKHSTRPSKIEKPSRPEGFPLFAHATRRWAKKIRGKLHYFGPWNDPQGALNKYLDRKDDLHAGRTPRGDGDKLTVGDLANRFLITKQLAVDSGELAPRTFRDYRTACERVLLTFGKHRPVNDLVADDFQRLRAVIAKTMGLNARKVEIQRTRTVFKYAYDAGLIDRPIRFGPGIASPSKAMLRRDRQSKSPRMFEPDELRAMLDAAIPQHKAMILLGINAGFGNNDVATLPMRALDLDRGWVTYPRPKTAVPRRAKLWPETVTALKAYLATRRTPADPAHRDLVFVTQKGNPWIQLTGKKGTSWQDSVTVMCRELLAKIDAKRPGLNFYALRHTFETVAGDSRDQVAVNHVMGHADQSMAAVYRERIADERLIAVAEHVRQWVFGIIKPR